MKDALQNKRQFDPCLIALLFGFTSFSCVVFGADYPHSDTFLVVGEMAMQAVATGSDDRPGSPFLIAVSPDRVLVGWTIGDSSPRLPALKSDLDNPTVRDIRQVFVFSALNLSHSISLECKATNGPDILQPASRSLTSLVRQRPLREATLQELILHAVTGPFGDCPLVFFAQDPIRNLGQRGFCELADKGEGVVTNEYCETKLLTPDANGHQSLLVTQKSDDVLSPDQQIKLVDAKSTFYPSGLQAIRITCEFDCHAKDLGKTPWTARTRNESTGINGKSIVSRRLVSINKIVTEPRAVNEAIDRILQLIPDGEPIITDGKQEYRWKNGRMQSLKEVPLRRQ